MARITDEMLMAYADGALARAEADEIERALMESDAECRDAIDDFRKTAALVRAAYAEDEREPIPGALVETVLGARPDAKPSVVPFPRPRLDRTAMALAASLAAVVVAGALVLALRPSETETAGRLEVGPVQAGSQLANVLTRVPASVPVESGAAQLMVAGTFYDRSSRICREVELMDSTLTPQQVAVACRADDADAWAIEGVARIVVADPAAGPDYTPAGASETDALKALHTMLGAKEPLTADEERRLIERGWQP